MEEDDKRNNPPRNQASITPLPLRPEKANASPQFYDLPILSHELIVEILSWLPVKSLIRFRCVSKFFKSLTSDPQFIQTHLRKIKYLSKMKPNYYERLALTYCNHHDVDRKFCCSCSLDSLINNPVSDSVELDQLSYNNKDEIKYPCLFDFVGSCDGLICSYVSLSDDRQKKFLVLWNPSTRFVYNMPDLDFEVKSWDVNAYGFGYDGEMNDYKVVLMLSHGNIDATVPADIKVVIFSQRAKCWRSFEGFRYVFPSIMVLKQQGKYVNGTLCWRMESERDLSWIIVSFDLAKETFNEVPQPSHEDLGYIGWSLEVFYGCLACIYYSESNVDIWVMEDFGVRESWTKRVSLPTCKVGYIGTKCSEALYITDSGEILLTFGWLPSPLAIYDCKDGTLRSSPINGVKGICEAVTYVESLVSPEVEN